MSRGDFTLVRLKRLLKPARRVLLPIWRRVGPLVEPTSWRSSHRTAFADGAGAIRPLTKAEFEAVVKRHPYYSARGRYMSVAAGLAGDLIEAHGLQSALELGPHLRPVIVGADVMDIRAQPELEIAPPARLLVHDATQAPWPVGDGEYDLFLALQVFEHLGNAQNAAFMEVCRVARHALISVPIDWEMDDPRNCHHRISHERALSWFRPLQPTRVEVGNPGSRKRLIYVFENLDRLAGSPEGIQADPQAEAAHA
jgi:hypothetical protein